MHVKGRHIALLAFACAIALSPHAMAGGPQTPSGAGVGAQAPPAADDARALGAERTLAAAVSEPRMVDTVRRLVAFGPRQYGTPSNHEAAAWLAAAFRESGLEVTVREDTPRNWYQPVSWEVRASASSAGGAGVALKTTWPGSGAPSGRARARSRWRRRPGRCA